jgi:hypothetical protein
MYLWQGIVLYLAVAAYRIPARGATDMPDDIPEEGIPEPRPIPIPIPVRPITVYSRGGNLSNVPLAASTAPADLERILAVDTSNPFLQQLRIQQGLLKATDIAPGNLGRTPITSELPEVPK